MAGLDWTYGQIRNYVQGSGCNRGDDRIEVMMVACVQELWTNVCDDPHYAQTLEVTVPAGESKVDISQCATISSIQLNYKDGDCIERCRALSPRTIIPEVKNCGCSAVADECEHDLKGKPSEFVIVGDNLCLYPTPDTEVSLKIECFREIDCTLYTEEDGVRTWASVDLPSRYQAQLANLVLSKFYAEEGDFAAATYWEQKVSTGLDSLIQKRANRYDVAADNATSCVPAAHRLVRRGGSRSCDCKSCSDPLGVVQTLCEEVYLDECGERICYNQPEEQYGRKW